MSTHEGNDTDKKPVLSKGWFIVDKDNHKRSALNSTTYFRGHAREYDLTAIPWFG